MFELRLKQRFKDWKIIQEMRQEIKRLIKKKREAHSLVKHYGQIIPEKQKGVDKLLDKFDREW